METKRLRAVVAVVVLSTLIYVLFGMSFANFRRVSLFFISNTQRAMQPTLAGKLLCTFEAFRDHLVRHNTSFLTGAGRWIRRPDGEIDHFEPDICAFRYGPRLSVENVVQCLRSSGVRRIAVVGDSNAGRTYNAFKSVFSGLGNGYSVECNETKAEHHCPLRSNLGMKWTQCDVRGTAGFNATLIVEFANYVAYKALEACGPPADCCVLENLTYASGRMPLDLVLFRKYLVDPKPDLVIVLGNSHDHYAHDKHAGYVEHFGRLMDSYASNSTKVIVVSKIAEYCPRKPLPWRNWKLLEYNNKSNHIMFDVLRHRFVVRRNLLPFLDHLEMTAPVQVEWSLDGVHMNKTWYQHFVSYIWQTFCLSDALRH